MCCFAHWLSLIAHAERLNRQRRSLDVVCCALLCNIEQLLLAPNLTGCSNRKVFRCKKSHYLEGVVSKKTGRKLLEDHLHPSHFCCYIRCGYAFEEAKPSRRLLVVSFMLLVSLQSDANSDEEKPL